MYGPIWQYQSWFAPPEPPQGSRSDGANLILELLPFLFLSTVDTPPFDATAVQVQTVPIVQEEVPQPAPAEILGSVDVPLQATEQLAAPPRASDDFLDLPIPEQLGSVDAFLRDPAQDLKYTEPIAEFLPGLDEILGSTDIYRRDPAEDLKETERSVEFLPALPEQQPLGSTDTYFRNPVDELEAPETSAEITPIPCELLGSVDSPLAAPVVQANSVLVDAPPELPSPEDALGSIDAPPFPRPTVLPLEVIEDALRWPHLPEPLGSIDSPPQEPARTHHAQQADEASLPPAMAEILGSIDSPLAQPAAPVSSRILDTPPDLPAREEFLGSVDAPPFPNSFISPTQVPEAAFEGPALPDVLGSIDTPTPTAVQVMPRADDPLLEVRPPTREELGSIDVPPHPDTFRPPLAVEPPEPLPPDELLGSVESPWPTPDPLIHSDPAPEPTPIPEHLESVWTPPPPAPLIPLPYAEEPWLHAHHEPIPVEELPVLPAGEWVFPGGCVEKLINGLQSYFKASIEIPTALPVQYDNAPLDPPDAGMWIGLSIELDSTDMIEFAPRPIFRIHGRLVASIYSMLEDGDRATLLVADQVKDAFRRIINGTAVFQTPSVRRIGRSESNDTSGRRIFLAHWQVDVSCPFHSDCDDEPAPTVVGTNASFLDTFTTIRDRFKTLVEDAEGIAVQYDDAPFDPPTDDIWVAFFIVPGESLQVARGVVGRYRSSGVAMAHIFQPIEDGQHGALALAEKIAFAFRAVTDREVRFQVPHVQPMGRTARYWEVNVQIPFFADELA